MKCEYCQHRWATQRHHVRYVPEVIKSVCNVCHEFIHGLLPFGTEVTCKKGSPMGSDENWAKQNPAMYKYRG